MPGITPLISTTPSELRGKRSRVPSYRRRSPSWLSRESLHRAGFPASVMSPNAVTVMERNDVSKGVSIAWSVRRIVPSVRENDSIWRGGGGPEDDVGAGAFSPDASSWSAVPRFMRFSEPVRSRTICTKGPSMRTLPITRAFFNIDRDSTLTEIVVAEMNVPGSSFAVMLSPRSVAERAKGLILSDSRDTVRSRRAESLFSRTGRAIRGTTRNPITA